MEPNGAHGMRVEADERRGRVEPNGAHGMRVEADERRGRVEPNGAHGMRVRADERRGRGAAPLGQHWGSAVGASAIGAAMRPAALPQQRHC